MNLSDRIVKKESVHRTELPMDAKMSFQLGQDKPAPYPHLTNAWVELKCRVDVQIPSDAPIDDKRMVLQTAVDQVVFSLVGEPVALLHQANWKLAQYKNAEARELIDKAIKLLS